MEKYPQLKKFHSCIRNFRNWSSHNKLKKTKLTSHQFALLFCIALRTYFDGMPKNDSFYEKLYDYEEIYQFKSNAVPDSRKLRDKLENFFKETVSNLKDYDYRFSLEKMVRDYGTTDSAQIDMKYLFLPLWNAEDIFKKSGSYTPQKAECIASGTNIEINVRKSAICAVDTNRCEELCRRAGKNDATGIFMTYCFDFLK